MRKAIYLLVILFYAGVGILGMAGNGYSEVGGTERMIGNNLVLIVVIALAIGVLAFYYFPRLFPKGYGQQKKLGKILIPALFLILSFACTVGIFLFVNASFGAQTLIRINGYIEKKWTEKRQKGRYDYFLGLRDSVSRKYYEFEVKRNIYDQVGRPGDKINRDFYKGSLGIIYRYHY